MAADKLSDTLFYSLEKAIKTYRQFAQANIDRAGVDITLDQWLVLKTVQDNPDITLQRVSRDVFKDFASVTRIVQLLEKKGYISRRVHPRDGRRSSLGLTAAGNRAIRAVQPVIASNRTRALKGLRRKEMNAARELLVTVTANCQPRWEGVS
ncbi:MAG TPA: MarR family transcriptional regulator [Gemmatimonadaceae bacterium]